MGSDNIIYTATMAKVYAEQGHYEKAARIYRHLLARSPEREDLEQALAGVEAKINPEGIDAKEQAIQLLCRWFELIGYTTHQRKLEHLPGRK
ncbi:MAG: hypothetical protein HKM93_10325 [Desulfobacteraceae bacterium]|nr:hypothetical protein [Desulfobacteraceae bacterium]